MIHHIILRVIAHATEDVSRVREALDFFLSGAGVQEGSELIEELQAEGHHGNPITILSVQLKRKADCLNFAQVRLTNSSDAITAKVKIETYPKNREKAGAIVEELFG